MAAHADIEAGTGFEALDLLLEELAPARPTRIADVGANPLTPPPYQPLVERGVCHLYGFEPQPEAFEALQRAASPNETYFPHAVGRGGPAELKLCNDSGLTSLYEPDPVAPIRFLGRSMHNIEVHARQRIDTVKLDNIAEIEGFDLLKIDVQGAEVDVFLGARKKMRGAMAVITETRFFPLYQGEPMLGGVDEELRYQGFTFHKFLFLKSKVIPNSQIERLKRTEHRNQILDGDAVYLRNMGHPEDHPDESLKHLAILASGVFESHDLALHCLDLLVERAVAAPDLPGRYVDALPAQMRKD